MKKALRGPRDQLAGFLRDRKDPTTPAGGLNLRRRVHNLEDEVRELQDEVQEMRRLNRRLAELMDVVEELLVPLSQRDGERVQRYLDSHATVL